MCVMWNGIHSIDCAAAVWIGLVSGVNLNLKKCENASSYPLMCARLNHITFFF